MCVFWFVDVMLYKSGMVSVIVEECVVVVIVVVLILLLFVVVDIELFLFFLFWALAMIWTRIGIKFVTAVCFWRFLFIVYKLCNVFSVIFYDCVWLFWKLFLMYFINLGIVLVFCNIWNVFVCWDSKCIRSRIFVVVERGTTFNCVKYLWIIFMFMSVLEIFVYFLLCLVIWYSVLVMSLW